MTTTCELPAKVSEYAMATGVSPSTVRRSIAAGALKAEPPKVVDGKRVPTLVVGGELAWTVEQWQKKLEPSLAAIKPHLRGWDVDGNLHILIGTEEYTVKRGNCAANLAYAESEVRWVVGELAKRASK